MTLFQWLISGGILALVIVSAVHSLLGEKLLLKPMFARRGNAVLESDLARMVIRFAWHVTSLSWIMMAVILYFVGFSQTALPTAILLTLGIGFLAVGLFDAIATRGRHVGWPVLTAIGVFCLTAYAVGAGGST
jgi:dolichyl-phosphate-mannose--protein O-mannosyl transferase